MLDQEIAPAGPVAEKGLDLDLGAVVDLAPLRNRPGTRAPSTRMVEPLHVGITGRVGAVHAAILFMGQADTKSAGWARLSLAAKLWLMTLHAGPASPLGWAAAELGRSSNRPSP